MTTLFVRITELALVIDNGKGLVVAMSLARRFSRAFESFLSGGAHFQRIEVVNLLLPSLCLPCSELMGAE